MLSSAQKRRYARHLLLAEIGEAGQERLCAARVRVPDAADARAMAVARAYLERAGLELSDGFDARGVEPGDVKAVQALAGRPELEPAAAALLGAFAAVEAIKQVIGAGEPGALPPALSLAGKVQP